MKIETKRECLNALFDWCMQVLDVSYLILTIDVANMASCKVAEKAGFELFEKKTPISHKQPNMESDSYYYFSAKGIDKFQFVD